MNKGPDILTVKERLTDDAQPKPALPAKCGQEYYDYSPWLGPHADSLVLREIDGAMCMQGNVKRVADPADLCVTPEGGVFPEGLSCTPVGEADAFCSADGAAKDDDSDGACVRCENSKEFKNPDITPAEAAAGAGVDDEEAALALKHEKVFQHGMEKLCYLRTLGQGVEDNLDTILHKCPLQHQCEDIGIVGISHDECLVKKEEEGEDYCTCIWKNVKECWEILTGVQIFHDECILRQEGAIVDGVDYGARLPCTCESDPSV